MNKRWVVVADYNEVFGPFASHEDAARWLKNKHVDTYNVQYEEWQCSDHDMRIEDHSIVQIQIVG